MLRSFHPFVTPYGTLLILCMVHYYDIIYRYITILYITRPSSLLLLKLEHLSSPYITLLGRYDGSIRQGSVTSEIKTSIWSSSVETAVWRHWVWEIQIPQSYVSQDLKQEVNTRIQVLVDFGRIFFSSYLCTSKKCCVVLPLYIVWKQLT